MMRRPPSVALELDASGAWWGQIADGLSFKQFAIIPLFPGSRGYLDGLLNIHTAI